MTLIYEEKEIGERLKDMRKDRKLTIQAASEELMMSESSLKGIENGSRNLTIGTLYTFMNFYGKTANEILGTYPDVSIDGMLEKKKGPEGEYLKKLFLFLLHKDGNLNEA